MSHAIGMLVEDPGDEHRDAPPHAGVLLVSCGIVLVACLLQVLPDQRVAFRGLSAYPLPPTCQARLNFGIDCPGCGLTRSFVHLAHADWRSSVRTHRFGWLLAGVVVFQIPYRALALRGRAFPLFSARTVTILSCLLFAVLLGNWLFDILVSRRFL